MTSRAEAYDEIKALNWSTLKHLAVSPLLYRWRLDHPQPSKPEFALGAAAHCAILEPDEFGRRYAEYAPIRNGKAWEAWQEEHPGVESLKPHEMTRALEIAKAVHGHRIAGPLLRGGLFEEVLQWNDQLTGLACKGRLDYLRPSFVLDLKTARDPSPLRFERVVADLGYATQATFYHDGAMASRRIKGDELPYIIAVQSDEPYDVAVYQLEPETLEYGRAMYRSLLWRLLECIEADYWPGVAPELQPLRMSPWAAQPLIAQESEDF